MPGIHVDENRSYWDEAAHEWVDLGERAWRSDPSWGEWGIPETELNLLPVDMTGMDAVELGCGTGYISEWMRRRGARVVGVDVSANQLATANRLAEETLSADDRSRVEFVLADAEESGLATDAFDFAISEYGAALWCEPRAWLSEARRLLRDGGRLVFLSSTPWLQVCAPVDGSLPVTERLERPYFGLYRLDWRDAADDPGGIEFVPTIAEWFAAFDETGFRPLRYLELQARGDAPASGSGVVTARWARNWPHEHVWVVEAVPASN